MVVMKVYIFICKDGILVDLVVFMGFGGVMVVGLIIGCILIINLYVFIEGLVVIICVSFWKL